VLSVSHEQPGHLGPSELRRLTSLCRQAAGAIANALDFQRERRVADALTRGFVAVQITTLVPAFIVAEATLSYVGFGFSDPVVSWGTMLQEASNIRSFADFPWLLSPAAAIFFFALGLNLILQGRPEGVLDTRLHRSPQGLRHTSPL